LERFLSKILKYERRSMCVRYSSWQSFGMVALAVQCKGLKAMTCLLARSQGYGLELMAQIL
jgi:hypothetical protein